MAIGLVVDDAIVVLENIYRHIEKGVAPLKAAFKGAQEIGYPVIAMTLTLSAVYAPIALSQGVTGKVFTEFAVTLSIAVILSGFVALTLSPMMCSRLLKPHSLDRGWEKWFRTLIDHVLNGVEKYYAASLSLALKYRSYVLLCLVVLSSGGWGIVKLLKQELVPTEDKGFFRLQGVGPSDTTLNYGDRYSKQMEVLLNAIPEIEKILVSIKSPGEVWILPTLQAWEKRHRSVSEILDTLKDPLDKITGLRISTILPRSAIGSSGSRDESALQLTILGSQPFKNLVRTASKVAGFLSQVKGVSQDVRFESLSNSQEFQITVNRDKAAALGVDVAMITEALNTLIGRRVVGHFKRDNKRYEIHLEIDEKSRRTAEDVRNFFIRGSTVREGRRQEVMVSLNDLVTIKQQQSPLSIAHYKGLRSVTLFLNLRKDASLGEVVERIDAEVKPLVPEGYQLEFLGEGKRYKEEQANVIFIYVLAVFFIFLVLAAQYESYLDPIIILSSIPLSVVGGLVVLKVMGGSLNLYSQIGLVTLIGLIAKHGILIVDFANRKREQGIDVLRAVYQASLLRLRPILMTTFAMVIGALPLALSVGAGAETRQQIGWVVVGGMTFGTLFTLYIVPIIYTYVSRERQKITL